MSFIGFIPIHVRHDAKLTPRDKVVYSEITANLNDDGICIKNNIHFANVLGCTKTTISSAMTNLRQGGFISIIIEKAEDSHKFIKRYVMPLPYTVNSIRYINSISKNKKIKLNKSINDKQLAFLKSIVSDFYKTKRKQLPKYITEKWYEDTNLTNGAVNVIFELITADKWSDTDVRDTIRWATDDKFWMNHLLSLRTLRDKSNNGLTKFANLHLRYKG